MKDDSLELEVWSRRDDWIGADEKRIALKARLH